MDFSVETALGVAIDTFDFTKKSWRDDVTFVVDEERLYASKCVLAINSPVFESMFGTDFKEKTENEIALPGKKVKDFLEFLHCVYPNSNRTVSRKNVFQVLPLADEYQVRPLLEKCEEVLGESVDVFSGSDLLTCYSLAARHNLSKVDVMCVEKIVNEDNSASSSQEAENIMDKDELLKFKTGIIAEQAKRMNEMATKLVKLYLKSSDICTSGFENAAGAVIEHTIENVFDPALKYAVHTKAAKVWNTSFSIKISVANKETHLQNEKFLSVFLLCSLPNEQLECEVKAAFHLENVFAVTNKIIKTTNFSNRFGSTSFGYQHFAKLSTFLSGTSAAIENYTGKLVVYILANKPKARIVWE